MTDTNAISNDVRQLIADKAKMSFDDVQADLNLEASGLDSFARIELILVIEEKYGIELSDSESANVATISDIVNIIAAKLNV